MHVSKQVLIGAAVAFALLIGTVGFLLGRESRRPRVVHGEMPAQAEMPTPAAMDVASTAPAPATSAYERATVPSPPMPSSATVPSPPMPSSATVPSPPPSSSPPLPSRMTPAAAPATAAAVADSPPPADPAIEIRNYFVQMASIQSAGPTGDPTEMANKLLAAAAGGDSSGFTALIGDVDSGIARAQQVSVPAACQEYHQKTLELLAESGRMLRTLRSSIARHDTEGLTALALSATSLQNRADALAGQARQIKSRYGVGP